MAHPSIIRGWFDYGNTIVRLLLGYASAFSRSVVEGFPKQSRTIVEALSKDCRTSLEQQSNTCRRNLEESCVWTHAKAPARSGLGLALGMVVFFLLVMGAGVHAQTQQIGSLVDTNRTSKEKDLERFPLVKHDPDLSKVNGLVIGDTVPDYLWDLPLWVVNRTTASGNDTTTLRAYQDSKLLVLDFWASWCTPCVKSVEKWRLLKKAFPNEVAVVTVHMDYDYKALPFAKKRGWEFPIVIGESAIIINRHFFTSNRVGGVAIVKDKKLVTIPYLNKYDEKAIRMLIDGDAGIESNPQGTYFENQSKTTDKSSTL